jgi:hypothetical protein
MVEAVKHRKDAYPTKALPHLDEHSPLTPAEQAVNRNSTAKYNEKQDHKALKNFEHGLLRARRARDAIEEFLKLGWLGSGQMVEHLPSSYREIFRTQKPHNAYFQVSSGQAETRELG